MIRPDDGGRRRSRSARRCATSPAMTVFTTHTPVAAGHDRFPAGAGRGAPGQAPRGAAPVVRRLHGAGPGQPGRPQRAVLHDRAGPQAVAARQRRQRPARRRSRGGCGTRSIPNRHRGGGADRPHHQRRPRPELGRPADAPALRPPPRRRLAQAAAATPRPGTAIETVDDAELWETQQVLKARLIDFVRRRLVAQARRRDEADAAVAAGRRRRSTSNALTIGFARRFATYKRAGPGPPGRRAARRAGQRHRPADPVHLRRQGPPRGPAGQGADPEHRPADPAGAVRRTGSSSSKTTT